MQITLNIPDSLIKESPTRKVIEMRISLKYENPTAQGFPEVCFWNSKDYVFDMQKVLKAIRANEEEISIIGKISADEYEGEHEWRV